MTKRASGGRVAIAATMASTVVLAVLAGCAKKNDPVAQPTVQTTPAATSAPATTAPADEEMGNSPAVLADGRHPVYLTKVDVAGKKLTFDLVIFLTGEDAAKEWAKRHPDDPELMNDYMIVNDNPKLRTLSIADDVVVKVVDMGGPGADLVDASLSDVKPPFDDWPFWITVKDSKITKMEEQFLP